MSKYSKELEFAIEISKTALRITEWFKAVGFESFKKVDDTPVTLADLAAQIYIVSNLKTHFPDDQIISEEDSTYLSNQAEKLIKRSFEELNLNNSFNLKEILNYNGKQVNRKWTIDPIDGTKGFQEDLYYAVGISLMEGSDRKISVITAPKFLDKGFTTFTAEKGNGAKVSYEGKEFIPIKVSDQNSLEEATLVRSLHFDKEWVSKFAQVANIKKFVRIDSMLKFCMVATGIADLYVKPVDMDHSYTWDYAPGDLLVSEAGGIISDLNNKPVNFNEEKFICKTPGFSVDNCVLHRDIITNLEIIRFWDVN
ncbi:MAG: hypothetical protein GF353_26800 [Candidatus Lokiarchaeota archaeon]|nr:hypothetical protein [Candidatus Lokiarchaeota archaeon]